MRCGKAEWNADAQIGCLGQWRTMLDLSTALQLFAFRDDGLRWRVKICTRQSTATSDMQRCETAKTSRSADVEDARWAGRCSAASELTELPAVGNLVRQAMERAASGSRFGSGRKPSGRMPKERGLYAQRWRLIPSKCKPDLRTLGGRARVRRVGTVCTR